MNDAQYYKLLGNFNPKKIRSEMDEIMSKGYSRSELRRKVKEIAKKYDCTFNMLWTTFVCRSANKNIDLGHKGDVRINSTELQKVESLTPYETDPTILKELDNIGPNPLPLDLPVTAE